METNINTVKNYNVDTQCEKINQLIPAITFKDRILYTVCGGIDYPESSRQIQEIMSDINTGLAGVTALNCSKNTIRYA